MTGTRNVPTPEGREIGKELAWMTKQARADLVKRLGQEAVAGLLPEPCRSCAFRGGTFPNGCSGTVLDALKCVMEGVPFYCHQSPQNEDGRHTGLCHGYLTARTALVGKTALPTPWPFSHEHEQGAVSAPDDESAA